MGRACGRAARGPKATIVSKEGPLAPRFFIWYSISAAISLSRTPGLQQFQRAFERLLPPEWPPFALRATSCGVFSRSRRSRPVRWPRAPGIGAPLAFLSDFPLRNGPLLRVIADLPDACGVSANRPRRRTARPSAAQDCTSGASSSGLRREAAVGNERGSRRGQPRGCPIRR